LTIKSEQNESLSSYMVKNRVINNAPLCYLNTYRDNSSITSLNGGPRHP
jgi:hypothetical protein